MLMLPVWHSYHSLQDSCNPCRHGQDKEESISPKGLHPVRAGNQKTPEISIKTTPRIQGETKECAIFSHVLCLLSIAPEMRVNHHLQEARHLGHFVPTEW